MDGSAYAADSFDQAGSDESSGTSAAGKPSNRTPRLEAPFHYATERTLPLSRIADRLPPRVADTLSARARRATVVAIRLSSRGGRAIHSPPTIAGEVLYLDYRDLAAMEAGAIVPDVAELIEAELA